MENKINLVSDEEIDKKISSFILMIQNKYNNNNNYDFKINGKILYYMVDETIIYFIYKLQKDSKENLFNKNIMFGLEFRQKKVPYIRALSNFITPTLYDGRNLFYCLLKDYSNNYVFDKSNLNECEKIIDKIIIGIKAFIISLKENLDNKVLIYYGEYTLNHVYLMNDFLMNQPELKFYRIYMLDNNKKKEIKYIIITQLFFLIFEPEEDNKSLGKLNQIYNIQEIQLLIENNSKDKNDSTLNSYFFKINKGTNNSTLIKFLLAHGGYQGKKLNQKDIIEGDLSEYLALKTSLEEYKNNLNLGNYLLIIQKSRNLFSVNEAHDSNKKKFISKNRCKDYKKYIEYYEILYDYYKKRINEKDIKEKLKDIFSCLTFFCVELITFKDSDPKENLIYKSKLEKYSKYCIY